MIISFSGIDGSGKTTYANVAMDYFKNKKLRFKYMHMIRDSFYHSILHDVIGRFSKPSQKYLEKGLRNPKNKIYFAVLKFIKKMLLVANLLYFNLRYRKYKGSTIYNIICDRYFYDEIVQMQYLRLAGKVFMPFYKNLIIKPDIAFLIKAKPEVAYARKSEFDRNYFLEKCKLYKQVHKSIYMIDLPDDSQENNADLIFVELKQRLKSL